MVRRVTLARHTGSRAQATCGPVQDACQPRPCCGGFLCCPQRHSTALSERPARPPTSTATAVLCRVTDGGPFAGWAPGRFLHGHGSGLSQSWQPVWTEAHLVDSVRRWGCRSRACCGIGTTDGRYGHPLLPARGWTHEGQGGLLASLHDWGLGVGIGEGFHLQGHGNYSWFLDSRGAATHTYWMRLCIFLVNTYY